MSVKKCQEVFQSGDESTILQFLETNDHDENIQCLLNGICKGTHAETHLTYAVQRNWPLVVQRLLQTNAIDVTLGRCEYCTVDSSPLHMALDCYFSRSNYQMTIPHMLLDYFIKNARLGTIMVAVGVGKSYSDYIVYLRKVLQASLRFRRLERNRCMDLLIPFFTVDPMMNVPWPMEDEIIDSRGRVGHLGSIMYYVSDTSVLDFHYVAMPYLQLSILLNDFSCVHSGCRYTACVESVEFALKHNVDLSILCRLIQSSHFTNFSVDLMTRLTMKWMDMVSKHVLSEKVECAHINQFSRSRDGNVWKRLPIWETLAKTTQWNNGFGCERYHSLQIPLDYKVSQTEAYRFVTMACFTKLMSFLPKEGLQNVMNLVKGTGLNIFQTPQHLERLIFIELHHGDMDLVKPIDYLNRPWACNLVNVWLKIVCMEKNALDECIQSRIDSDNAKAVYNLMQFLQVAIYSVKQYPRTPLEQRLEHQERDRCRDLKIFTEQKQVWLQNEDGCKNLVETMATFDAEKLGQEEKILILLWICSRVDFFLEKKASADFHRLSDCLSSVGIKRSIE